MRSGMRTQPRWGVQVSAVLAWVLAVGCGGNVPPGADGVDESEVADQQAALTLHKLLHAPLMAAQQSNDPALLDPLFGLLTIKDTYVRTQAMTLLARRKDPRLPTALAKLLDDPGWEVRAAAAQNLGQSEAILRRTPDPRQIPNPNRPAGAGGEHPLAIGTELGATDFGGVLPGWR